MEGKASDARAEDVQVGKVRGGGLRVEGVWMSQKGIVGKEKVAAFQGFVAADKSRVEFKTLMLGCIVRFGDADELGVVVRVAKCPMNVGTDPKVRLVAVVTPVREAFLGLLPAISMPFLQSPTSWQVVPFSKVSLVACPSFRRRRSRSSRPGASANRHLGFPESNHSRGHWLHPVRERVATPGADPESGGGRVSQRHSSAKLHAATQVQEAP